MPVNRATWKSDFTRERFLSWPCANCGGKVALRDGTLLQSEAAMSLEAHSHDAWEPSWIAGRFTALLHCGDCKDPAVVSGVFVGDEFYGEEEIEIFNRYEPKFISPPPALIDIIPQTPEAVEEELEQAFALFWTDAEACANRLRSTLERILDDQRIQKVPSRENRRVRLSLHSRLELLHAKKPDVSELLMAAKWIGNAGSHGAALARDDLFDGFDLIEQALVMLYSDTAITTKRLARGINKRRKPKPKKRTK